MKQFSLRRVAELLGSSCENENCIAGFQIDSRKVGPGELFFALAGEKVDGHRFLGEVKQRGGIGAIVARGYDGPDFGMELIRVENVEESLRGLAKESMRENRAQIAGVTGSVGKTTTKEFIATLLEGKYRVGKTMASYNTKLTFPLMLLNREGNEEVLVLEMGVSEPGDMDRLLEIAAPDVAVLTKVALAHAAFFPEGVVGIAREKAKIFSRAKRAIFDYGLYMFQEVIEGIKAEKIAISTEVREADYFLSFGEGKYWIDERGVRAYQCDLPFSQSHILQNLLMAVAVARAMKMEWEEIGRQIPKLKLPKMRFEVFEKEGITFINDAYNANPASMLAALANLPSPREGGKRIGVLGTMKELGPFSEEAHREVGRAAIKGIDHLLVLGKEAAPLGEAFEEGKKPVEQLVDCESAAKRLRELMCPGDVVLVKGSRSMNMETIFEQI